MNILEEIIAHKHVEIDQRKRFISPRQLYALVAQRIEEEEKRGLKPKICRQLCKLLRRVLLPSSSANRRAKGGLMSMPRLQ